MATTRTMTLKELGITLESLSDKAPEALRNALQLQMLDILRQVVSQHMTGQDLGVVTGTARRSMRQSVVFTENSVKGEIGSPLAYVRAHEEGFSGTVNVRAHVRALYGRSDAITKSGRRSTAKVVKMYASVRAHDRDVNIKAKRFLAKAIREMRGKLKPRFKRSLVLLAATGRVPTLSEITG